MKQLRYLMFFVASLALSVAFYSCDDDCDCENSAAPIIHRVFLQDVNSSVPDREVDFARLGQVIRIEGENLLGLTKVFFNEYSSYFNPVFITNTSMIVQISRDVPIIPNGGEIRLVKGGQSSEPFPFEIRSAAPSITKISHTLPLPGEWITVYGSGLSEVSKVVFPGGIVETTEIIQGINEKGEPDGKSFKVKVPNGISENGGSIFIECSNGGAYSPAYFGCKNCVVLDFDGRGVHGFWGSGGMINDEDILSAPLGQGNVSQGNYCPMLPSRLIPISAGTPRATEVWTSGNEIWSELFVESGLIAGNAPVAEVAVQFDIYVPADWSGTGMLGINLTNSWSAGEQWTGQCYNYIPWLNGATKVPFNTKPDKDTPASWVTVTVPLSEFYFVARDLTTFATFNDVIAEREKASYKNFGLMFHNNDFTLKNITGKESDEATVFESASTSVGIYVDNLRIVSLATPKYSDFPE